MSDQEFRSFPAYYTGGDGRIANVIARLRQQSGNVVPLVWEYEKIGDGKYSVKCMVGAGTGFWVDATVDIYFLTNVSTERAVAEIQLGIAKQAGLKIIAPERTK